MSSGTSPPRPLTSPSRTSTSRSSWAEWTSTSSSGATSQETLRPGVPREPPPSASSTRWILPGPGWRLMWAKEPVRGSSLAWATALSRSLSLMAWRACTKDLVCLSRASSSTEQPILGYTIRPRVRSACGGVTAREDPFSKGTLGHLAIQGQAGLGTAPVECSARNVHRCFWCAFLPPSTCCSEMPWFGLTPGLMGDYSFTQPFPSVLILFICSWWQVCCLIQRMCTS